MPDIWFEVLQPKARGKDQDEWAFEVLNAESWGMPVELDQNGRVDNEANQKEIRDKREADDYFKSFNWTSIGATYTELEKHLRSKGLTSNRRISYIFNVGMEYGIIYKSDKRKYHYNGLTQQMVNDQPEALPFDRPDNEETDF